MKQHCFKISEANKLFSPFRCSDCAKLKPDFEGAAKDFARKGKFVFAKVSVNDDRQHLFLEFSYQLMAVTAA